MHNRFCWLSGLHSSNQDLGCTERDVSCAPVWISAHKGEIACVAFNQEATKIATASVQGTLIRVWELATKAKLLELRRGTDPATIYWYYLPSPRTILLSVSASISVTIRSFFVARATKERSTFSRSRSRRGTRGWYLGTRICSRATPTRSGRWPPSRSHQSPRAFVPSPKTILQLLVQKQTKSYTIVFLFCFLF